MAYGSIPACRTAVKISMFYDPMIAKLIVHGKDRSDAIAKAREALNGFVIRGVQSNIPFHAALLAHPNSSAGTSTLVSLPNTMRKGFDRKTFRMTIRASCWHWRRGCTCGIATVRKACKASLGRR